MVQVAEWLKKLVGLIVFASFIELLLPSNNLKGVTRLVVGLLVIMLLIQPLTQLFNISIDLIESATIDNLEERISKSATNNIIAEGETIRNTWETVFKEEAYQVIEHRIKKILTLIEEIELEEIELEQKNGQIEKVTVDVRLKNNISGNIVVKDKLNQEIIKMIFLVSNLNISVEKIEVKWNE